MNDLTPILSQLVPIVGVLCLIGIPMTGLVIRYALTPLVEKLAVAIRGSQHDEIVELRERLAATEELLEVQQEKLDRLVEAERFHQELASNPSE